MAFFGPPSPAPFIKKWKTMAWNNVKIFFYISMLKHIVGNKAKRQISKRVFQENKARQFFRKTNISYPLIRIRTRTYQGVRNVRFSENLTFFVFLKHPFWDSPFCLITDENVFALCTLTHFHLINFSNIDSAD